jgi:GAF domain-containing protein
MNDSYLATMVRIACDLAGAQGASLFLVDGNVLRPYIIYNLPEEYIAGIGTVRIGSQCCGRAVEQKKPWIVTDMLTDPLFAEGRDGAVATPIRAAFSVPVVDGESVVASLACHYTAPFMPTELDIERNEVFAKLIAISLKGREPGAGIQPIFTHALDGTTRLESVPISSTQLDELAS